MLGADLRNGDLVRSFIVHAGPLSPWMPEVVHVLGVRRRSLSGRPEPIRNSPVEISFDGIGYIAARVYVVVIASPGAARSKSRTRRVQRIDEILKSSLFPLIITP